MKTLDAAKKCNILQDIQFIVVDTVYMVVINILALAEDLFSKEED